MSDEIQFYIDRQHACTKQAIADNQFNAIALNLTRDREKYENEAYELIKKYGFLKALKVSRG